MPGQPGRLGGQFVTDDEEYCFVSRSTTLTLPRSADYEFIYWTGTVGIGPL